jgi:hypothetical protein
MKHALVLVALLGATGNFASAQSAAKSVGTDLRASIEPFVKNLYEQMGGIANVIGGGSLSAEDAEEFRNYMKGRVYNMAYAYYRCKARLSSSPGNDAVAGCYKKAIQENNASIRIIDLSGGEKGKNAEEIAACEQKARLSDAETEFPPYDFLKRSDGRDILYDYAVMERCLTAAVK